MTPYVCQHCLSVGLLVDKGNAYQLSLSNDGTFNSVCVGSGMKNGSVASRFKQDRNDRITEDDMLLTEEDISNDDVFDVTRELRAS